MTAIDDLALDSAPAYDKFAEGPQQTTYRTKRKRSLMLRLLLWLVVIAVVIVLSMLVTAWISGFRYPNGMPDIFSMIEFVLENAGFF